MSQKLGRMMHSGTSLQEFFDSLGTTIICFHAIIENISLIKFHGESLKKWKKIRAEYIQLIGFLETFVPSDIVVLSIIRDEKINRYLGSGVLEKVNYINAYEKCKNLLLKITKFFDAYLSEDLLKKIVTNGISFGTIIGSSVGVVCARLFGTKYSAIGLIAAGIYGTFCYSRVKTTKKWKDDLDNVCSKILEHVLFMETNMSNFLFALNKIKGFNGYKQMYHIFDFVIPSLENLSNISKKYVPTLK